MPQYAIAQLGSSRNTPSNVRRAIRNQYEWIIATPRSNSACTLGSQEVGKLSLPSFSSCWPNALQLSAAVIPATSNSDFGFMGASGRVWSPLPPQWVAPEHDFANEMPADGIDRCRSRSGFRHLPLTALGILHRLLACVEGSRRHFIGRDEPQTSSPGTRYSGDGHPVAHPPIGG